MFGHLTKDNDAATEAAFADPQVGDAFHEMYTFRMFVIGVEPGGRVAVLTVTPPCTLPNDGTLKVYESHGAYRSAFAYRSMPGYWIRLDERGINVTGWLKEWPAPEPDCRYCADLLSRNTASNPSGGDRG
jgi:hypothetical protein